jgi:hypothetical protein
VLFVVGLIGGGALFALSMLEPPSDSEQVAAISENIDVPEAATEAGDTSGGSVPAVAMVPGGEPVLTGTQIFADNESAAFRIFLYDENREHFGFGSGFVLTPEGVAVTNSHVMTPEAYFAEAVFEDGRTFEIVGFYSYDFDNDLAVIQIDGEGNTLPHMTIGDSDTLLVGEAVYAIGGPTGDPITFASGLVSRLGADVEYTGDFLYFVESMIQVTASIYEGSSGSALLNDRGQVIGVIAASDPYRDSVQWAIPINRVNLPSADEEYNPLPVDRSLMQVRSPRRSGSIFSIEYPFMPDLLLVSQNARLFMNGKVDDIGSQVVMGGFDAVDHFDYVFLYYLPEEFWIKDTDEIDNFLDSEGFIIQQFENTDNFLL